jgi:hypothetical protein
LSPPTTLTPKQKKVYDLLEAGDTPPQIAKRMGLSTASITLHMRNMRKAGVALPNGKPPKAAPVEPEPPVQPEPVAVNNLDPITAKARQDAQASLRAAIDSINAQIDALGEQAEKFEAALAALN